MFNINKAIDDHLYPRESNKYLFEIHKKRIIDSYIKELSEAREEHKKKIERCKKDIFMRRLEPDMINFHSITSNMKVIENEENEIRLIDEVIKNYFDT